MMLTSGSRPPTRDISAGCSIEDSRRSSVALDGTDDLRRRAVHDRDPVRDLGLHVGREPGEQQRGLVRRHVREHERDHLRVLVDDERPQLGRVGAVQELERHLHRGGVEPLHDLGGALGAEALLEQLLGEARGRPGRCAPGRSSCRGTRASTASVSAPLIDSSRAISAEIASTSVSDEVAEHRRPRARGPAG